MTERAVELALVGAGPTASSLLERLAASVRELLPATPLRIHLVDPFRAGTGRVWRPDLDARLWMNSMAEDVTMFTDTSVRCEGPVRPGPSLIEWAHATDDDTLRAVAPDDLIAEIRALDGMTFPTRRVQSAYLHWFHHGVLATLPDHVEVVVHAARALDITDVEPDRRDGRQRLTLDDGTELTVDVVVCSLGHLDAEPDAESAAHAAFAARHGLTHLPPGHTAEQDLAGLAPGEDVIVLGFGQAFTDLVVLVTEGRGGRFERQPDGSLRYHPSGAEPVLHVGSRRGVPYRSKPDYRLQSPLAPLPRFLDDDAIAALAASPTPLDFDRDLFPLLAKEAGWAYYHELFHAHGERTALPWTEFADRYTRAPYGSTELADLVAAAVPDPYDRFSIEALDRPLRDTVLPSAAALQDHLVAHIAADVARRTDTTYSADLGAFMGMLLSFGPLAKIGATGRVSPRARVTGIGGWWFSFFMYYASGPPPDRLRQFLALADAGLLRFVGADTTVTGDPERGVFVARSSTHPDDIVGTALVDARIAGPSVSRTAEPLLAAWRDRGEIVEEVVTDGEWCTNTGRTVVQGVAMHLVDAEGRAHPRRHGLGVFTSRPAASAFARPRTNAPSFRQNDAVARAILTTLAAIAGEPVAGGVA